LFNREKDRKGVQRGPFKMKKKGVPGADVPKGFKK